MSLREWADYFHTPPSQREKILNVITLEIGDTPLGAMVVRPQLVRDLDWVDLVWPQIDKIIDYPRVQLYCLMGVQCCYTDFHVDFGGSSVFYHILSGEKIFYFVEPSPRNLKAYEEWSSSPDQGSIFFPDMLPPGTCIEAHIVTGNTYFYIM